MTQTPAFRVDTIPVYGDAVLAPLSRYTDPPYRQLCREFGSAMSYTELLDAEALLHNSQRTRDMLAFLPEETPKVCQIFGSDAQTLAQAAQIFESMGATIIDLNLGCSVHKVTARGAGAALLQDPRKVGQIIAGLVKAVSVPVTAKIRLGWTDAHHAVKIAQIIEENGAALVAVHGRTAQNNYRDPADWDGIAAVKEAVSIPVLGNGDIQCAEDIQRMQAYTNCDGVMIGRAAMGNPWIFKRQDLATIPLEERCRVMHKHLTKMIAHYGEQRGFTYFQKHIVKYVRGLANSSSIKRELLGLANAQELLAHLQRCATGL